MNKLRCDLLDFGRRGVRNELQSPRAMEDLEAFERDCKSLPPEEQDRVRDDLLMRLALMRPGPSLSWRKFLRFQKQRDLRRFFLN